METTIQAGPAEKIIVAGRAYMLKNQSTITTRTVMVVAIWEIEMMNERVQYSLIVPGCTLIRAKICRLGNSNNR